MPSSPGTFTGRRHGVCPNDLPTIRNPVDAGIGAAGAEVPQKAGPGRRKERPGGAEGACPGRAGASARPSPPPPEWEEAWEAPAGRAGPPGADLIAIDHEGLRPGGR